MKPSEQQSVVIDKWEEVVKHVKSMTELDRVYTKCLSEQIDLIFHILDELYESKKQDN